MIGTTNEFSLDRVLSILELASLGLTAALIIVVIAVLSSFRHAFTLRPRVPTDWLIAGIVVSFLSATFDNLFWQFVWTGHFLNRPGVPVFFEMGPAVNVFFRQIPTIIAAYCHIRAGVCWEPTEEKEEWMRRVWLAAWAACLSFSFVVLVVKVLG